MKATDWRKDFDELREDCKWQVPEVIKDRYKSFIAKTIKSELKRCKKEVIEGIYEKLLMKCECEDANCNNCNRIYKLLKENDTR